MDKDTGSRGWNGLRMIEEPAASAMIDVRLEVIDITIGWDLEELILIVDAKSRCFRVASASQRSVVRNEALTADVEFMETLRYIRSFPPLQLRSDVRVQQLSLQVILPERNGPIVAQYRREKLYLWTKLLPARGRPANFDAHARPNGIYVPNVCRVLTSFREISGNGKKEERRGCQARDEKRESA
ncbi:hypothetical protein KM043_015532 [Ampulex compressa]|nr:hypothetical protein KM043_015532 [Ampulex compressa]